jgi:hypothetical protein
MGYVGRKIQDIGKLARKNWNRETAKDAVSDLSDSRNHFDMTYKEILSLIDKFNASANEFSALIFESTGSDQKALENAKVICFHASEIEATLKKLRGMWSRF